MTLYVISRGGGLGSTTPVAVARDLETAKAEVLDRYGATVEPFTDGGAWRARVSSHLDWVWVHRVPAVGVVDHALAAGDEEGHDCSPTEPESSLPYVSGDLGDR